MLKDVAKLVALLERAKIKYCVIGGFAVLLYGGRASTIDFDFYVLTLEIEKLRELLLNAGASLREAGEYQLKAKFNELPIDILIADRWVGVPALKRARKKKIGDLSIRIATPEDLIVMKSISDRPVDRRDIEELKELFAGKLDEAYVKRTLQRIRRLMD